METATKKVATKKTSTAGKVTPGVCKEVPPPKMSRHDALVRIAAAMASGAFARKDVNVTEMEQTIFVKAKYLLDLIEKDTNG